MSTEGAGQRVDAVNLVATSRMRAQARKDNTRKRCSSSLVDLEGDVVIRD
ncbi:MAG: hypothetical protein IPH03_17040 [Tetrasphaera sp.]|nr:hypothetical protein [Tetrasphaera sp.]